MVALPANRQLLVLSLVLALPVLGAVLASSSPFTIDELIYLIATDAMAVDGSLIVENGYEELASNDLKLWFLIDGPNGLTPQYPSGFAVLAAPLYLAFGAQGLVLLNALAAAGCVGLTWALARKLYESTAVATVSVLILTFCTFHLDYAWSIWPHMTSAFFVLLAFYLAVNALDRTTVASVLSNAIGSGLAVGAGMLMRADTVLVLPIIATCIIVSARRPVLTLLGGVIGLLPGVVTGALINLHKFGTPNILSYGRTGSGGGTDVTSYLGALPFVAVGLAALLLIRSLTLTRSRIKMGAVALTAGFVLLLIVPQTRDMLQTLGRGFMALFVDARTIVDPRDGVVPGEDGSLLFWGVAKKALFQSLPWLAVLVTLVLVPWRKEQVRAHAILLFFVTVWSLPFVALAWHGGFSSSMRYFLPTLPVLVILASAVIVRMAAATEKPVLTASLGILAGLALGIALYDSGDTQTDGFTQQALTLYVFLAVLLVVAAAPFLRRFAPGAGAVALLATGVGLGNATFASLLVDVSFSQQLRARTAATSRLAETLQGPLLIYGSPKYFAFGAERPDVILAMNAWMSSEVDVDLFVDAIRSGYRAMAPLPTAEHVADATGLRYIDLEISPNRQWVEIVADPAVPAFAGTPDRAERP